jgi:hypothetical protein
MAPAEARMTYSLEEIERAKDLICREIAEGSSLKAICARHDVPSRETIYQWLADDSAFSDKYVRAREDQADFYADEIIDIADTEPDANKARVRIDARKWKASKLQPKKYGDKVDLNLSGTIGHLSDEQLQSRLALLVGKAGAGLLAGGSGEAEGEA